MARKKTPIKAKLEPQESASYVVQALQHEAFCRAYIRFGNGVKALAESGMDVPARSDAALKKAQRLLVSDPVKARIKEICHEIESKHAVNLDSIISVHSNIMRANASDLFDDDFKVKSKSQWSEQLRRSVRKIDVTEKYVGDVRIVETKIDFADKAASANALYKILGYESAQKLADLDSINKSGKEGDQDAYNRVIQRAHDRAVAIAAIAASSGLALSVEGS